MVLLEDFKVLINISTYIKHGGKKMFKRSVLVVMLLLLVSLTGCLEGSELSGAFNNKNYINVQISTFFKIASKSNKITASSRTLVDGDVIYSSAKADGNNFDMYIIRHNKDYYTASKTNVLGQETGWILVKKIEKEDIEEVRKEFNIVGKFSANDFEKEEDGLYVLKHEKLNKYKFDIIEGFSEFLKDSSFNMFTFKLKITNKRISKIIITSDFTIDGEEVSMTLEMTYSKFGEVTIHLPEEITKKLD